MKKQIQLSKEKKQINLNLFTLFLNFTLITKYENKNMGEEIMKRIILALIIVFIATHFQLELTQYIEELLFSLSEEDLYDSADYAFELQENLQIAFEDLSMQQIVTLAAGIPFFGYMIIWILSIAYAK